MKYKRILVTAFSLALTLPLLTVSAHPGRTDGNGGHTDSDTGDYHYHHGYPAHDHYDIDGDGSIDCPYDFDDKTGQNSGAPSSDNTGSQPTNGTSNYSFVPYNAPPSVTSSELVLETFPSFPTLPDKQASYEPRQYTEADYKFGAYACTLIISFAVAYPFLMRYDRYKQEGNTRGIWAARITGSLFVLLFSYLGFFLVIFSLPITVPCICYKLYVFYKNRLIKETSKPKIPFTNEKAEGNPQPLPPQTFSKPDPDVDFWPVLLPESEVSPHTRCRDTCRYLWYETLMIRSRVTPPPTSDACIYLWTALFYTAVKTLRSQASVDRIYSYFAVTTGEFVTEARYTDLVVDKVRTVYRQLREPLNKSGIDPRTANGRRDLWHFLEEYSGEFLNRPDLEDVFLSSSQRVWQMIADVFPQAHPYPKAGDIRYSIEDLPEA